MAIEDGTALAHRSAVTRHGLSGRRGVLVAACLCVFAAAGRARATEVLCDPSFENWRTQRLALIDNEQIGIDAAFWFMEDQPCVRHIIARWNAGVPPRDD